MVLTGLEPSINWDYLRVHVASLVLECRETALTGISRVLPGEALTIAHRKCHRALLWLPHVVADREPMIVENPADPRNRRVSITLLYRKAPNGFRDTGASRLRPGMAQPHVNLPAHPAAGAVAPRKTASGH